MKIRDLESKLHQLLPSLNLKPTLDRAADIGDILHEAKTELPHGEFGPWLRRFLLNRRTAWDYMAVSKARSQDWWPATTSNITIKQFLRFMRQSIRAGLADDREFARQQVAQVSGNLPDHVNLVHADCTRHLWPKNLDAIVANPPWGDIDCYRWLAEFAVDHLKPNGLLFVQCGTYRLPQVVSILSSMTYAWTLNITYKQSSNAKPTGGFVPNWSPVLLYTNGTTPKKIGNGVSDVYTVTKGEKGLHDWQQPAEAWRYWLSRLVPPGTTVADPFAGSGTIGAVCAELGLVYHGTQKDNGAFEVARGRLAPDGRSRKVKRHRFRLWTVLSFLRAAFGESPSTATCT